jgi:Cof subfamily protein (haloacid dehalogenase superfamily)
MKILVFDLDDTLWNRQKQVGRQTRSAIIESAQAGAKIIFATSRPERAVRRFLDAELFALDTIISLNGAILRETTTGVSQFAKLGQRALPLITHAALNQFAHMAIEFQGYNFATNVHYTDHELETLNSATRDMVIPLDVMEIDQIAKVAVNGLGHNIDQYCDFITSLGMKPISCENGTFLNVVDPAVDKSSTLKILLDRLGLDAQEMVVFGDDIPDLEMMKMGGLAVAMGNARDEVKAVADVVLGDCDNDEIGPFLRQLA